MGVSVQQCHPARSKANPLPSSLALSGVDSSMTVTCQRDGSGWWLELSL